MTELLTVSFGANLCTLWRTPILTVSLHTAASDRGLAGVSTVCAFYTTILLIVTLYLLRLPVSAKRRGHSVRSWVVCVKDATTGVDAGRMRERLLRTDTFMAGGGYYKNGNR